MRTYLKTVKHLLLAGFGIWATGIRSQDATDLNQALQEVANREIARSDFEISGTVVDNSGKLLNGVTMHLDFSRSPRPFGGTEHQHEESQVNGIFRIRKKHYSNLEVNFTKAGYYPARYIFSVREKIGTPAGPVQRDLRITLRPIGIPVQLRKLKISIAWWEHDDNEIINFSKFDREKKKKTTGNTQNTYLALEVGRNENGEIIRRSIRPWPKPVPCAVSLKFVSPDQQDGMILVENAQDLGDLKEAPEHGYTLREIPLGVSADSGGSHFFYYRANGLYGKGQVSKNASSAWKADRAVVSVLLMQNEANQDEGPRNVTSAETGFVGPQN